MFWKITETAFPLLIPSNKIYSNACIVFCLISPGNTGWVTLTLFIENWWRQNSNIRRLASRMRLRCRLSGERSHLHYTKHRSCLSKINFSSIAAHLLAFRLFTNFLGQKHILKPSILALRCSSTLATSSCRFMVSRRTKSISVFPYQSKQGSTYT